MSDTDNIFRLIGLTTVAIIGLLILFGVLLFVFGFIGTTNGLFGWAQNPDQVNKALSDYQYKLDLVKEQTQRLDMYYAAKTSTEMTQVEFRSWLGTIGALTNEFIDRENNATSAGRVYLNYLDPKSGEYNRVIQNEAVAKDDIKKVAQTYNGNAYLYNQQYGAAYGNVSYLE